MKERQNSETLFEHYADAVTALVMDRYVSALAESLAAEERVPVEIGAALDSRCRKIIKKGSRKNLLRSVGKKLLRGAGAAVIALLLLGGVFAILFSTVEAIRVPIVNYFAEKREEAPENSGDSPEARAEASGRNYLEGLLPAGYELAEFMDEDGILNISYKNSEGENVCFNLFPKADASDPETEDAATEELTIGGCAAVLITKDGSQQIAWSRDGEENLCQLEASAMSREDFIALAEAIESRREGLPPAESGGDLAEPAAPPENDVDLAEPLLPAESGSYLAEPTPPTEEATGSDHIVPQNITDRFAFPRPQPVSPSVPPEFGSRPIEIDIKATVTEIVTYPRLNTTLTETSDDQLVWSSVDGQQTGNDSAGETVTP